MKLSKIILAAALPAALMFASCDNNDGPDGSVISFNVAGTGQNGNKITLSAVKDLTTNTWRTYPGANYAMKFDFGNGVSDVQVSNLQYMDGNERANFTIPTQKFLTNSTMSIWTVPTVATPITATGLSTPLTDYSIWLLTYYGQTLIDMDINYTIGNYFVRAIPVLHTYTGITNTNTLDGTSGTYPNNSAVYSVTLKPETQTVDIAVKGAKFDNAMPSMDMVFPDIPYKYTDNGFTISADKIIPTINKTPYENYALTNVNGALIVRGQFTLNFNCAGKWHTDFKGMNPYYPVENNGGK